MEELRKAIDELQYKLETITEVLRDFIENTESIAETSLITEENRDQLDNMFHWDHPIEGVKEEAEH